MTRRKLLPDEELDRQARTLSEQQAGVPRRMLSALDALERPGLRSLSSGLPSIPAPCSVCGSTANVGLVSRSQDWRCGAHIFDDA